MSETDLEVEKAVRSAGEYLSLRRPTMLERFTSRPWGRMRGRRERVAVRVP